MPSDIIILHKEKDFLNQHQNGWGTLVAPFQTAQFHRAAKHNNLHSMKLLP